jgi:2-dehydropantoate 2-reductase
MQDAGFVVQVSNAVLLEMWEKWVLLATFAGMTCLMRGAIGDIVAAGAAGLTEALLEECRHIAASEDQVIRPDVLQRIRALLTQAGSTFMASMLRDLELARRLKRIMSSATYCIASLSWLSTHRRYYGSRISI